MVHRVSERVLKKNSMCVCKTHMSEWFTWFTALKLGEKTAQHVVALIILVLITKHLSQLYGYINADRTAPDIILHGEDVVEHERGTPYKDAGATTPDPRARIETTGGDFSVDEVGEFLISYVAVDQADNRSETLTRTVKVVDTIAPDISLVGDKKMYVITGTEFVDPGAITKDDTANITVEGAVDTATPGEYVLSYTAIDPSSNASTPVRRTVVVVDILPSSHTLIYMMVLFAVIASIIYAVKQANSRRGRSEASVADI